MKIMRKLTVALIVIALMIMVVPAMGVSADEQTFVIFHTNDIHGRAKGDPAIDKDGNLVTDGIIGYARYKTIIHEAMFGPNAASGVFVFDAGDALHGTNFASLSKGENMVELMNDVGVDAMVLGNHEFNYGVEQLHALRDKADFGMLGMNITNEQGDQEFGSWQVITIGTEPEFTVGVFGITTPETKVKAHPDHTKGLNFNAGEHNDDPAALAAYSQKIIDNATDRFKCDYVIVLAHVGCDEESTVRTDVLASMMSGVDLYIDGHSHQAFDHGVEVTDKDGEKALIVQTGSHFHNIGKVTLKVSDEGIKTSAELLHFADVADVEEDPNIQAKIEAFEKANEVVLGEVIGSTATDLVGERAFVRTGETNLGNLITDAMLKASGADVVLTNGGGIRASIPAGEITMGQAQEVLPFGNQVTVIKVTGQDIIDALAHGAKSWPEPAGGFPHVAGMTWEIVTEGEGEDAKFKQIGNVTVAGKPIDPNAEYTLATNDFMASGGDGYEMFGGKEQVTLLGMMLDIFVEEIKAQSADGPFTYATDGRLKIVDVDDFQPGEHEPDETEPDVTEPDVSEPDVTEPPTQPEKPDQPDVPSTGETTVVYVAMGTILLAVAVVIIASRRKVTDR
jgi:5'-nucleotidase/UDP-sugar diphosphatase